MAKGNHGTDKRYVYKLMDSPIGRLTLVASDDGLAGIRGRRIDPVACG